jgi:hypothetical protein
MMVEFVISRFKLSTTRQFRTLAPPNLRAGLEQIYQASAKRGVNFLVVATGEGRQTYPEQLQDAFPNVSFGQAFRIEFLENSDHIFTSETARMDIQKLMLHWLHKSDFEAADGADVPDVVPFGPGKDSDPVCDTHGSSFFSK